MTQATFSVRMDDTLKEQFEILCAEFGMNMSTAINIFARAVVRERRIPFEIAAAEPVITRQSALAAFYALRRQAANDFPDGMPLDDINAEIDKARNGEADA